MNLRWNISLEQRPPVAQFFSKFMGDELYSISKLAEDAKVSETYVWYLRNFASNEKDITFLLNVMRKNRTPGSNPYRVAMSLKPEIASWLRSHDNMSEKVRTIYQEYCNAD